MINAESIGKIFSKKRQELGFDLETVASKTYMNVKVLNDMESGVFDNLSPVYMKSFIKKYSDFLGLDTGDILKRYGEVSLSVPRKGFAVTNESAPKKEIRPSSVKDSAVTELKTMALKGFSVWKKPQTLMAVMLAIVFVVLVIVLVNVTKNVLTSPPREVPVVSSSRPVSEKSQQVESVSKVKEPTKVSGKKLPRASTATEMVTLTLKASDRAWVQLASSSEGKIFDGFLNAGDSRTWKAEGTISIWTGKAEMLDFTVNGKDLGTVAAGVVKNIKVSADGVLIGDDWVKTLR